MKDEKQDMAVAVGAGLQKGFLSPVVGKEYDLSQAPEAHKDIIENKGAKGKLVISDMYSLPSRGSDGFDVSANDESQTSTANSRDSFPKCFVLNARSLRNKVLDLQALLLVDIFDVVAITETWLDSYFGDHELLMDGFNIFRKGRHIQRGGGVLLAVRNHLPCSRRFDLEVEVEMLALEICLTHKICVVVAAFYRSSNSDADTFLFQLRQFLDKYSRTGLSNAIVTGDFNFPNIDWYTGSPFRSDPSTEEFCNILGDFFLIQKNMSATRGLGVSEGNILDLVLTNNEFLVRDVSVHPNAFDSDQSPLTFTLVATESNRLKNVQRKVYCYKKADFIGLRETLHHIPFESVISDCPFEDCLTRFQDILFSSINQFIPQVTLRRRSRPPWIRKCQERIVYSAIYSHVSAYLSDWQHGFVKGRSTATQLILTHHKWAKALDEGHQVDVGFLYFSKAFDRVPHQALLHKLCNFGISGELLNWCQDYLSNRRQRVVIDGYSSSFTEITCGVPQGSILGPLFFVLFINDLPDVVCSASTIALYADDSKMFRVINCDDDQMLFENDLDKLYHWSQRKLMDFNSKKCKIMRISKNKCPLLTE
ncbi:uncharacterized protein [Montipora capricornis]|uniref:uncharacterized protein n=1 Tax=Montipora capricornis TaxID=246305 RepID=UPI0035F1BFA2